MSAFVVIGTSPWADTSVVVGPFRSMAGAQAADVDLTHLGYNTEVTTCSRVTDLEPLVGAPSDEDDWEDSRR